jgi:hypothetical protein
VRRRILSGAISAEYRHHVRRVLTRMRRRRAHAGSFLGGNLLGGRPQQNRDALALLDGCPAQVARSNGRPVNHVGNRTPLHGALQLWLDGVPCPLMVINDVRWRFP